MKKRSMLVSVLLVMLIMALAMLAACDSGSGDADTDAPPAADAAANDSTGDAEADDTQADDTQAPPAELPDDLVTLTAFHNSMAFNAAAWGEDAVSREIIERTGVTIDWEINATDDETVLNLMVASGDLPDLIFGYRNYLAIRTLQQDGSLYSWCELFERYSPETLDSPFFQRNRTYLQFFEGTDAIYKVPSHFVCRNSIESGMHIMQATGYYANSAIMDAIGNPRLETLDDLEHVLQLAMEYDPTIANPLFLWNPVNNGWDANGITILHRSMGGRGDHYVSADGNIYHIARCPLYRDTMMFVNRLFNQGLISHNTFTDETLEQEAINTEGSWVVALGHMWRAIVPNDLLPGGVEPIVHLVEPGVTYFHPIASLAGGSSFLVPRSTSDTAAVARLLSFIVTDEGRALSVAGVEGEHWEWGGPDGQFLMYIGRAAELNAEGFAPWQEYVGAYRYLWAAYPAFDSAAVWGLASVDPFRMNLHTIQNIGVDASEFEAINPDPESLDGANMARITDLFHPFVARIAMAPSEAEAQELFDEMIATLEASGLEGIEAVWTQNVNANRARLGR